jgi:hypothetical protein
MSGDMLTEAVGLLKERALPEGGFRSGVGGGYRPDATAWAVMALRGAGAGSGLLAPALERLAADQAPDGRLCISPRHPETFWPTPLGILAWQGVPDFVQAQTRAVQFLLSTTGEHHPNPPDSPTAHDSSIPGWPWVAGTHSWVHPTSLAMIALRVVGQDRHPRVMEGQRLLLDRQLPAGGWNYGNTKVFDTPLHPMPESTGLALNALAGRLARPLVLASLAYLKEVAPGLKTPKGLAWSLLGLSAWGERPEAAAAWLAASFSRQARYGPYDTESLALLVIARKAPGGLDSFYAPPSV